MKPPKGYEIHKLPADYTGPVWIEGQLRQFADSLKPLLEDALYALEYANDMTKPRRLSGCDCPICTTILKLKEAIEVLND